MLLHFATSAGCLKGRAPSLKKLSQRVLGIGIQFGEHDSVSILSPSSRVVVGFLVCVELLGANAGYSYQMIVLRTAYIFG